MLLESGWENSGHVLPGEWSVYLYVPNPNSSVMSVSLIDSM